MRLKIISIVSIITLVFSQLTVLAATDDDVWGDAQDGFSLEAGRVVTANMGDAVCDIPEKGPSLDMSKAKFYEYANLTGEVPLPTAKLEVIVNGGTSGEKVYTPWADSGDHVPLDVVDKGKTKPGYFNPIEGSSLVRANVGDRIKISDQSTPSGKGGQQQYMLTVEGSSTAASQFSGRAQVNGSGSAIRSGWLSPVEFTVTAAMAGYVELYYTVSDGEWSGAVPSQSLRWYEDDGDYYSAYYTSDADKGVFNPYYYTKMPGYERYHPGGFGTFRNWSQNGNRVVYGEEAPAFPGGTWHYTVAVRIEISAPTIDVVKVYQNEGPPYIADVVTEKSTANPYTIPAGGGDFKVTEWKQIRAPKPASIVDTTDLSASPWSDYTAGDSVASGTNEGATLATEAGDTVYILYTGTGTPYVPPVPESSGEVFEQSFTWQNNPVGFAEVKQGTFVEGRGNEAWEAMSGTPTTETLYINAGGTPAVVNLEVVRRAERIEREYIGTQTASCPGHTNDAGGTDYCNITTSDEKRSTITWNFNSWYIKSATVQTLEGAKLEHAEILGGSHTVNVAPSINVSANRTIHIPSIGVNNDSGGDLYGFTDGVPQAVTVSDAVTCESADASDNLSTAKAEYLDKTAFAKSDKLTLTIDGKDYEILAGGSGSLTFTDTGEGNHTYNIIVPSSVYKVHNVSEVTSTNIFGNISSTPMWDDNTFAVIGYKGTPTNNSSRNNGTRIYKHGIAPVVTTPNGKYDFTAAKQHLIYSSAQDCSGRGIIRSSIGANSVLTKYTPSASTVNSVIFHNPISAQNVWIQDIPNSTLYDQRIAKGSTSTAPHASVGSTSAPPRGYISYNFTLIFGNQGSLGTSSTSSSGGHFGYSSTPTSTAGTGKGLTAVTAERGSGFTGTVPSTPTGRSASTPSSFTGMGTGKWTKAKFVKFEFDVVYNNTFQPKNTWIKLWESGSDGATYGDPPTSFAFHIPTNVKDIEKAKIQFVTRAINSLSSDPETLWDQATAMVNGKRTNYAAPHSARNELSMDVIGRIGNFIVDDTNDPYWGTTFWGKDESKWVIENYLNFPDITTPISKFFSVPFGMFEETDATQARFNDRFGTLQQFHSGTGRKGNIPIRRGTVTEQGFKHAAVKMGYEVQFSVQTLGDYDNEVHIIPTYELIGFDNPSNFGMYAARGASYLQQYWSTGVNQPYSYTPDYKHAVAHSLKSARSKINAVERNTPSYTNANSLDRTIIGTPSLIKIPQALRTYIGSTAVSGYVEKGSGLGTQSSYNDANAAWRNAQRWHGRISLPSSTMVATGSSANPTFVKKSFGQYIMVYMSVRTRGNAPWDLTTRTNVAPNAAGNPVPIVTAPAVATLPEISVTTPSSTTNLPVIMFDYSNDSSSDAGVVGTH